MRIRHCAVLEKLLWIPSWIIVTLFTIIISHTRVKVSTQLKFSKCLSCPIILFPIRIYAMTGHIKSTLWPTVFIFKHIIQCSNKIIITNCLHMFICKKFGLTNFIGTKLSSTNWQTPTENGRSGFKYPSRSSQQWLYLLLWKNLAGISNQHLYYNSIQSLNQWALTELKMKTLYR